MCYLAGGFDVVYKKLNNTWSFPERGNGEIRKFLSKLVLGGANSVFSLVVFRPWLKQPNWINVDNPVDLVGIQFFSLASNVRVLISMLIDVFRFLSPVYYHPSSQQGFGLS